jgi:hypothetical protein
MNSQEFLAKLKEITDQYDNEYGQYPESTFEGGSVYDFARDYLLEEEKIPDTTIKWTPVINPPNHGRVVHILFQSGTIHTVQFFSGQFMDDNGEEIRPEHIKGWSYVDGIF